MSRDADTVLYTRRRELYLPQGRCVRRLFLHPLCILKYGVVNRHCLATHQRDGGALIFRVASKNFFLLHTTPASHCLMSSGPIFFLALCHNACSHSAKTCTRCTPRCHHLRHHRDCLCVEHPIDYGTQHNEHLTTQDVACH